MDQAKGTFKTNINRDKRPGDSKPVYHGRLTKPGTEEEYAFALFVSRTKTGEQLLSGPISRQPVTAGFDTQMDALLDAPGDVGEPEEGKVSEFRVFLLRNSFKDTNLKEGAGERPALWGRAQLGAGEAEIQLSVWEKDSRYAVNPHVSKYLTGSTEFAREKAAPVVVEQPAAPPAPKPKGKGEREGR